MGKCQVKLIKGKNAGQICCDYTNKTINGVFYCAGHYNAEIQKQKRISKPKPKPSIQPELTMDLSSGYSVDEIIEYEYKKMKDNYQDNNDLTSARLNHLFDKFNELSKKIEEFETKKDMPRLHFDHDDNDFEVFN